jgi:hypothetical protein
MRCIEIANVAMGKRDIHVVEKNRKLGTALGLLALVVAVLAAVYWFYLVNQVAIPENRSLFVVAFLLGPVLCIAAFVVGTRWYGGIPAVLGFVVGAFLTATIAISKQQVADNPIKVGDTIPYFTAINDKGETFRSDVLAGTPVLVKFFRAHW